MKRVVPKVQITNYKGMKAAYSATRKGLVIVPQMDLKTNGRLGEVWVVARLAYTDGYYVRSSSDYYNWGGTVATYYKMNLIPNSSNALNQTTKNFEMFLPDKYIPNLDGDDVIVELSVMLDDPANNQMNRLLYYKSSDPLNLPKK